MSAHSRWPSPWEAAQHFPPPRSWWRRTWWLVRIQVTAALTRPQYQEPAQPAPHTTKETTDAR